MAAELVPLDEPTWLIDGRLRLFLRKDALVTDTEYRPAFEYGIDPHPPDAPGMELLEVRTRALLPAGWQLKFWYPKRLYLPLVEARLSPIDTNQFRRDPEGDIS